MPKVKLISAQNVSRLLPSFIPVDATWYMPNSPNNARAQFDAERIDNSVFFDLDAVCSPSKYPHMLPSQLLFQKKVGELGINSKTPILVYDRTGVFSGPRAAWTFALFGHPRVYLLDHFPQYKADFDLDTKPSVEPKEVEYEGTTSTDLAEQVIDFEELAELVKTGKLSDYVLFDARSTDRFTGKAPEPRPGLSSGHVPGALSLPFQKVLDDAGHYKLAEEILQIFKEDFGIDLTKLKKKVIVMCGTGVTAVILRLAIEKVADVPIRVYDGSWTEWAQRAPELIVKDV